MSNETGYKHMYAVPKASYDAYIQSKSRHQSQEPSKRVTFGPNEIKEISPRGKGRPVRKRKRNAKPVVIPPPPTDESDPEPEVTEPHHRRDPIRPPPPRRLKPHQRKTKQKEPKKLVKKKYVHIPRVIKPQHRRAPVRPPPPRRLKPHQRQQETSLESSEGKKTETEKEINTRLQKLNKYSFNPSHIVGFKYGTRPQNLTEHQATDIALAKKASDLRRQVLQPKGTPPKTPKPKERSPPSVLRSLKIMGKTLTFLARHLPAETMRQLRIGNEKIDKELAAEAAEDERLDRETALNHEFNALVARTAESAKKAEKDKDKEFERLASAAKATAEKQKRRKIRYAEFTSNTPNPNSSAEKQKRKQRYAEFDSNTPNPQLSINPHASLGASPALNKVRTTGPSAIIGGARRKTYIEQPNPDQQQYTGPLISRPLPVFAISNGVPKERNQNGTPIAQKTRSRTAAKQDASYSYN